MNIKDIITEASIFDERELLKTQWTSPKQLSQWLKGNGFQRLSGGAFASVYHKPGHKRIIKISNRQDKCWLKFAMWALDQPNNKYVPNIPWVKTYHDKDGRQFFVTIIERLLPFNAESIRRINDPVILAKLKYVDSDIEYGWSDEINARLVQVLKLKDTKGLDKVEEQILSKNKNHLFIKTLAKFQSGMGLCDPDLHDGNIMVRPGTYEVVFTDPIFSWDD